MVGVPYNSDNCIFVSSQALNANQFNGAVPDAVNTSNHLLLWDFIDEKLYWVNSLTNIIEHELPDASGGQNEQYLKDSTQEVDFSLTPTLTTYGANYLVLPAGTYYFDLEYTYFCNNTAGTNFGVSLFQIRTNTNTSLTGVDASDVIIKQRETKAASELANSFTTFFTQTIKTEGVTFASSFIVKSAASIPDGSQNINGLKIRAFKVK